MSQFAEDEGSSERPKLSLQPRGNPNGTPSSTPKATRPNPFGAARPREQVIAEREGKQETEVLKEQASKEWKPQVALTEAQREEKKAAEAELAFAIKELESEEDSEKVTALKEEVADKEKKLEELLASFEKVAVQPSTRRPSEKRREEVPLQYGSSFGGRDGVSGDGSFGNYKTRGRDSGAERFSSYGEAWGGQRRSGGQSECYTCGELGHFARECPRGGGFGGGNFGGRAGGGRACYACGQEGHISRDCPQGGGYSSRGGGYGGAPSYGAGFGGGQLGYFDGNAYSGSYGSERGSTYDERRDNYGQGR